MSNEPNILNQMLQGAAGMYFVTKLIGKGGMANVYQARPLTAESGRDVAIKHFPQATDISAIEMRSFEKELAALTLMKHKNVISLLDNGIHEGIPFLVLELMECNLVQLRDRGQTEAFDGYDDYFDLIGKPVLDALAFAHGRNQSVTHRDVKPRNILIGHDSSVKLADFGIARLKGSISGTKTIRDWESKPYTPPEPDLGDYSDTRDVFSFAALTVWALTDVADSPVNDYPQLYSAFETLDVHPRVKEILKKALSKDPADRQENAVQLKLEIDGFLRERRQKRDDSKKDTILLKLTNNAKECLDGLIGGALKEQLPRVLHDINDCSTISRWRTNNQASDLEYAIAGAQFLYRVVFNTDREEFVVRHIECPSNYILQNNKLKQAASPVNFEFTRSLKFTPLKKEGLLLIDEAIRSFSMDDELEDECPDLFRRWRTVMKTKREIEESRTPLIEYKNLSIEGDLVTATVAHPNYFDPRDDRTLWLAKSGNFEARLQVNYVDGNEVEFRWRSTSGKRSLPAKGKLKKDNGATIACLERQETALELLVSNQATRTDLSAILLDPEKIIAPNPDSVNLDIGDGELDQFKQEAIKRALSTEDILLVHGPPGTGKTRLIAFLVKLIREQAAEREGIDNPVLLVSQSRVAVDHALHKLNEIAPELNLLRISADGDVEATSKPFLRPRQIQDWRSEVESQSEEWIRELAKQKKVDPDEVIRGTKILEYVRERQTNRRLANEIADLETQITTLKESPEIRPSIETDIRVLEGERNLKKDEKKSSDSDLKKFQRELYKLLKDLLDNEEEIESQADTALRSLAQDFLGESQEGKLVKDLMELRAEWLQMFGRGDSFNSAVCERADVVGGTCMGFIGLKGINSVEFDVCIIDEASKASVADCIVPMVRAKKWIMVGDTKQLPPHQEFGGDFKEILDANSLSSDDLSESLFSLLEKSVPEANQVRLKEQHRMNRAIGGLVANCFYPGHLEPGNRPPDKALESLFGKSVVWVSTDGYSDRKEQRDNTSYYNPREVSLVLEHLKRVGQKNLDEKTKVLLLSSYSSQLRQLEKAANTCQAQFPSLEVSCKTIDSVQGQEAKVVFYSITRTPPNSFVDDLHRVNVALSRAEELLVIVGDASSIQSSPQCKQLNKVLSYIQSNPEDCKLVKTLMGARI